MSFTQTLHVPKRRHVELIGQGGSVVRDLQTRFNVRINIPKREDQSAIVTVSGQREDTEKARREIENTLGLKDLSAPLTAVELDVRQSDYGIIIGRAGSTLRDLESRHAVSIRVPQKSENNQGVLLEGTEESVQAAITEIEELLRTKVAIKSNPSKPHYPPPKHVPAQKLEHIDIDSSTPLNKVLFFPDTDGHSRNMNEFLAYISSARNSLEICVFTITDDRIANVILEAAKRKVKVRIITDDDQSESQGSDIGKFSEAGIPTKMDKSPYHMHHKFALIDGKVLINGSFNWTRGASEKNCENVMITNNKDFVSAFARHFEEMWKDTENFKLK